MLDRLTDSGRGVIDAARAEVRRLKHRDVGTEHLLLGLFHDRDGMAAQALYQLGIDEDMVRSDVTSIVGVGEKEPKGVIPLDPYAKKVVELAYREASRLGHEQVGPEHILLSIQRNAFGTAPKILANHLRDPRDVWRTVLDLMRTRV
jgi:ATP-dependent Clp protease ATP-binding subunit ClpC